MERLHRDSDGTAVTLSGYCGIRMLRETGKTEDGISFFEYRPGFNSPITRIEWQGDIVAIPTDAARAVVTRSFARHLTDIEVAAWNDAIDKAEEAEEKKPAPTPEPAKGAPEPAKPPVAKEPPGEPKDETPKLTPEQEALLKKAEEAATAGKKPDDAQ